MNKSSGNVLFMILIAVALFAALSYAVTSSTRSGGGDVSKEKMASVFSEMQNTVVAHRHAFQRMIVGGVDVDQINSYEPSYYNYDNTACNTKTCHVYISGGGIGGDGGGGLSWYPFQQLHKDLTDATSGTDLASNGLSLAWVSNLGTEKADFIYIFKVNEKFCNFINQKIGVSVPTTSMAPVSIGFKYQIQSGTINSLGSSSHAYSLTAASGGQAEHLANKDEGCFKSNETPAGYWYFAVIYSN